MEEKLRYRNDYGLLKEMIIKPKEDGTYDCQLWCLDTGNYCGSGNLTREQLNKLCEHYGLEERF